MRATEAGVIDLIEMKLGLWMTVLELLYQVIVLGDVLGSFHPNGWIF